MAKLDNRGFVDDGTDDLEIEGSLLVDGSTTIVNGLTVLGTATLPNLAANTVFMLVQKTSAYTLTASDYTVECTSGTFEVTLPTAVGSSGRVFNVKNSGSGTITVVTTSSQTIDGDASASLIQYECLTVQSNGSNWIIL